MCKKTRLGNGQTERSDGLLNHREPGVVNMQSLTRRFSKGLAVAFGISLTPWNQEF